MTTSDDSIGQTLNIAAPVKSRKPGRPRAIPVELEHAVANFHRQGHGYRAIARILREDYHINPHYSSVRLLLKRLGLLPPFHDQPQSH